MKVSIRTCPICKGVACESLHAQRFVLPDGHPLAGGYDVVCCDACGFVYADTAATQRQYDLFYAQHSKYEDSKTSTGAGETPWDADRLRETAAAIDAHLRNRNARIIDIGCANGGLLRELKQLGFNHLLGLDPSSSCVLATQALGVDAQVGSLAALPQGIGSFDCIVLSHVMEHVHDLIGAVNAIAGLCGSSGCVYIEVPDAPRYHCFVTAPFQDFNTEHINHFSLRSLTNLMAVGGFAADVLGVKTILSAPSMPYPAAFGFFGAAPLPGCGKRIRDDSLRSDILAYIAASKRMMSDIDARLRLGMTLSSRIIVWGTGQLAMKLLAETVLGQANIAAFVDGNPINQGKVLRGIPIISPESARALTHPIVIASTIHQKAIAHTIREEMNMLNPLVFLGDGI